MDTASILANEPVRPLTRAEYDTLVEAGAFAGEHVELLWGVVVQMSPQGAPHSWTIDVLNGHFASVLVGRVRVRVQMPFAANDLAEPEPDLALVAPSDEWRRRHPDAAHLVIEVSRTSQRVDRKKLRLYAGADVPEVWIVDLADEVVEVYSDPRDGQYDTKVTFRRGESLAPRAFPEAAIPVDAILP
jgi:Uma2 family endonuclease